MNQRRSGLTLLELVVVLAILAVLATVAVVMTEGTVDQARYDATQRTLQGIDDAILGPVGQPDAASFIADIGRLPQLVSILSDPANPTTSASELAPAELWQQGNLPTYGPVTLTDTDIRLFSGWRGPYLRLAPGQNAIRDGWGNHFNLLQTDGVTPSVAGDPIRTILSLGGPSAPYNVPLTLPVTLKDNAWQGTLSGTLFVTVTNTSSAPTGPSNATVKLYHAKADDPSGSGAMAKAPDVPLVFAAGSSSSSSSTVFSASYVFSNVPCGLVALRGYSDGSALTSGARSTVNYLRIPPQGTAVRDLYFNIAK
jgi:prepilin-type N-terminal cleavage/methylation domain-containing protein